MGKERRGREVWQGEEGKREGEERGEVEGLEARKGARKVREAEKGEEIRWEKCSEVSEYQNRIYSEYRNIKLLNH